MGNGASADEADGGRPPPSSSSTTAPEQQQNVEANAACLWQRMLEHAIEAAAVGPDDDADADADPARTASDDAADACGTRPPVISLVSRTTTSLVLGVDAALEAARATYDVEICEATSDVPAWRPVATGCADRSYRVDDLRPNAGYRARARRRAPPSGWGLSPVLRCTGQVPSWFEAWRHKKARRADSRTEVLALGAVSNRLGADISSDLLRRIHAFLTP